MATVPEGYLERGLTLVKSAESGLRALLAEAAEEGDYDAVGRITTWARQVRGIVDSVEGASESPRPSRAEGQRQPSSKDYPKFYKIENKLLMVGWAKKTQAEYEHKAPRAALDQLVRVLLQASSGKELMETDALLENLKSESGERLPDYYGRTFLRWLRTLDLVEKKGHSGYSVKNRETFAADVEHYWRRLPTKN